MASLNRVQLIGRLGKDPEQRFTPKGSTVTNFTIAVNRSWRNAEGEAKEETEWFNIEVWGKLGDFCQRYFKKGRLVYLEGRLHTNRYEQAGETHYFTKVIARQVQILDRKPDEDVEITEEEDLPE